MLVTLHAGQLRLFAEQLEARRQDVLKFIESGDFGVRQHLNWSKRRSLKLNK